MGLGDLLGKSLVKSTVLTEYQADTKQMRFELDRMSKEEKKRHRALIKQTEEQNYQIDKANKAAIAGDNARRESLAKVGIALGAAAVAYKVLGAAVDVYRHNSKLAAATVGVDIEGLRKATRGQVDDTRLLEFAAKGMNGTFKLTQKEMEGALRGTMALRKEGNDLNRVLDGVQKSLAEGGVESMKEFGITATGVAAGTKEGMTKALELLNAEAEKMGGNFDIAGDGAGRAATSMANAKDSIAHSAGEIVDALSPLIEAFATLVKLATSFSTVSDALAGIDYGDTITSSTDALAHTIVKQEKELSRLQELRNRIGSDRNDARIDELIKGIAINQRLLQEAVAKANGLDGTFKGVASYDPRRPFRMGNTEGFDATKFDPEIHSPYFDPHVQGRTRGKGGKPGERTDFLDFIAAQSNPGLDVTGALGGLFGAGASAFEGLQGRLGERNKTDADEFAQSEALRKKAEAAKELADQAERASAIAEQHAKEDSMLSKLFGTPSEIDAQTAALQALASTFDGFAGAFGAGVDALITGSSSFADAFKNAIGESLRAMAVEMSISALKHTAYGLASLAFLDGRGAAAHFAAAGTFAAGAVAAGGGARLLGAGQSQSAPSTAGSAGVGTSGGAANSNDSGRGSTQVFIVGNDFAGLPARQRESQWRQISRSAGVPIEGDAVIDG